MKFILSEKDKQVIKNRIIDVLKDYLSEEDRGLFITTTNHTENIDSNLIEILKAILKN